jgi:zinc protease
MRRFALLGLVTFLSWGCASNEKHQPTPVAKEEKQSVDQSLNDIDYSKESYRVVADKDLVCTVLKNGLTIIGKRISSPVLSVQGLCHTGSVYEGKWLGGGLSHLLEHLLAGGTNLRRTEAQNRDLLQSIGDNSNAYTSYDQTVFFVNTTPHHMNEAVDLVTGWLFTSKIPVAEYRREYQVVQRELEKDAGEADWVFADLTSANRYQLNPARMPVVGYQDVIRGLSRDDVYAYYKMTYVPQNVVIAVAGNADPEAMVAAVRKYAGNIPPGRVPDKSLVTEPPVASPRTVVATFPKLGQAKLEIAFPSVRMYDPDMYPLDVLSAILSQGDSSILIEDIRDEKHLVSSITASDNTPTFVEGSFSVDMDLDASKLKETTDAVLAELEKIKKEGVPTERLERAKTQLRAADAFARQSAEAVSTQLVNAYMSAGYPEDITLQNYEKVTPEQIKAVANKYFDTGKLITTALLPAESPEGKNLPSASAFLRQAVPTTQKAPSGEVSSEVTRLTLQDGTVVLLKRVATSPVVSMQLYSLGGLSVEDEKTNGIGNLIISSIDRGTKTRNADEIATGFDSIGGQFDASCASNSWNFSVTFLRDDLSKAFDLFSDVIHNPTFPPEQVAVVKKRVQAAIENQDHDWFSGGFRYFRKIFFGPSGSPYQFTAYGTKERVERITPEEMRDWYQQKVLKGKKVLAIYGDIDVPAVRKLVEKHFGAETEPFSEIRSPHLDTQPVPKDTARINVDEVKIQKWENTEVGVFVGFRSNSEIGDARRDALIMADTLCSGYTYPTGYIFETLRGEGLVYDANAQNFWGLNEKLPGMFWAYAACDPKNVDKCVDGILLNIARLQGSDADMDMKWFARSKDLVGSVDAMQNETAQSQAQTAATDELFGLGYDYHAKFAQRIKAVTPSQVRAAARVRLRDCVIAISTAKPGLVKTKTGVREYKSFPSVDLAPQGVQHDTGGK